MQLLRKKHIASASEKALFLFLIAFAAAIGYFFGRVENALQFKQYDAETQRKLKIQEEQIQFLRSSTLFGTTQELSPSPQTTPTPTPPLSQSEVITIPTPTASQELWGIAKQVGESTWTMRIQMDDRMATPQEVYEALNEYRYRQGKEKLTWDDRLARFAQSRAEYFTSIGTLDEHKGFAEYTKDIENVKKLGFWHLGENSSFGYRLYGVHLIEWVYAGDDPHDLNQINSSWTHVGIGVNGTQSNIIFGGNPM